MEQLKHTAKATVFEDLFSYPENLLALYKALHPEDKKTTIKDLKLITLKRILTTRMINDLGFMVGMKLFILVEAQSSWSFNIIPRLIMYLVETWYEYFKEQNYNLYSSKKIVIPEPELYVVYTGERKIDKEYITLSEEFFEGKKIAIDARVRVLKSTEGTNILTQYIRFCKIFDQQRKAYPNDVDKAIEETIRICKNNDVLKEYLQKHEREAENIMFSLFNQEYVTKMMLMEKEQEGIKAGIKIGKEEGIEIGKEEGVKIGKEEGVFATRAESFKLFLSLGKNFDELVEYYKMTPEEAKTMREYLEKEKYGNIEYKQ